MIQAVESTPTHWSGDIVVLYCSRHGHIDHCSGDTVLYVDCTFTYLILCKEPVGCYHSTVLYRYSNLQYSTVCYCTVPVQVQYCTGTGIHTPIYMIDYIIYYCIIYTVQYRECIVQVVIVIVIIVNHQKVI